MTIQQADQIDGALRLGLAYCEQVERQLRPKQSEEAKRHIQAIKNGIKAWQEVSKEPR